MSAFTKNIWYDWYDWLINYISEPIKESVGWVKDQIISLFKTKDYSKAFLTNCLWRWKETI